MFRWMAPDLIKFFQLTSNGFQKGKLHEFNIEPSQSVWNLVKPRNAESQSLFNVFIKF